MILSRPNMRRDTLHISKILAMPKLPMMQTISEMTRKINRVGSNANSGTRNLQQMVKMGEKR